MCDGCGGGGLDVVMVVVMVTASNKCCNGYGCKCTMVVVVVHAGCEYLQR